MRLCAYIFVIVVVAGTAAAGGPPNTSTIPQIVEAAYGYLESHLVRGERWGMHYHFYRPSLTKYSSTQWLWDSGSHMISWSHRNVTNSILDLRTMLQMQHPNGFISEEVFWGPESPGREERKWLYYGNDQQANNTQMPVLAFSLRAIYQASGNDTGLLREFLPKLVRYWRWWSRNRAVSPHEGLVSILHGWESGLDASPLYDAPYAVPTPRPSLEQMYPRFVQLMLSYHFKFDWNTTEIFSRDKDRNPLWPNDDDWFIVEDIGVNAVYVAGWGVLGDLALELGDNATAAECHGMERRLTDAVVRYAWNASLGHFVSFYKDRAGAWTPIYTETVQSVMVLLLRHLPRNITDAIVDGQLKNQSRFGLPFPVPSVAADEPSFNPVFTIDLMWRGPSWAFPNWFIMEGLQRHGYDAELNDMMQKWIAMVKIGGIYEMYNPLTAAPYGQEGLGMSCLIVDWLYRLNLVPPS